MAVICDLVLRPRIIHSSFNICQIFGNCAEMVTVHLRMFELS